MEDLSSNCLSRNTFPDAFHHVPKDIQADTFLTCLPLLRRIRNRKEWNINNIKEHKLKQFVSKSDITGYAMRSLFVTFFCLPYFPNL